MMRAWPWRHLHVQCSGLRARRVALIYDRAYLWRIFWWPHVPRRQAWVVVRTLVASVDDHRQAGVQATVAARATRSAALQAAEADLLRLGRMTIDELVALEESDQADDLEVVT